MRVICSVHPKYLGKKKPTSKCICCNALWNLVNNKDAAQRGGYSTLFGYDDRSSMRIVGESNHNKNNTMAKSLNTVRTVKGAENPFVTKKNFSINDRHEPYQ